MKTMTKHFTSILLLVSLMTSCGSLQDNPDEVSDYDTVITHEDPSYENSFSTARTFGMPDYVIHPSEDNESLSNYELSSTDQVILDQAMDNMLAAGYTYVEETSGEKPDLIVLPYSFDVSYAGTVTAWPTYDWWYDYWGWGGFYPGWGGYYPYYGYPVSAVYAYDQGTVVLEIADNREVVKDNGEEKTPIIWQGILNGTETNTIDNQNRIVTGIDQMFTQSPYISTSK
ncbi:DUF4136 domain-containing protein [Flammeovirga sp. SR4]|uniref:DUF4136 domain-containing protein n=2 Tax=Flammeovirga agarivorans TaxID=2726742 RepID=A0A7X8XYZ2_9BACT|nr:DUF4136 domain-containing protein [Flammeovirga agarivorans]